MSLFADREVRGFGRLLLAWLLLFLLLGMLFRNWQTGAAKDMLLTHDRVFAASLLEQGVSGETVARALADAWKHGAEREGLSAGDRAQQEAGEEFLAKSGYTKQMPVEFLPAIQVFQSMTGRMALLLGAGLSLFLLGGIVSLLWKRERLCRRAEEVLAEFARGDYSRRLPQAGEGTLYRMFVSVERLTTMLKAKNEAEQKAKETLREIISNISHQLKTPLSALLMYQEIMEGEPENPEVIRKFSAKAGQALGRMERLILLILKIARLDAGSVSFDREPCPLSRLMTESLRELTTRAEKEGKELLLSGPREEILVCDETWTGEAIGNIVKNALDHTEPGGKIRISWEKIPGMLRIVISDNGSGISPDELPHIFKRFYRSPGASDRQGVGLGLPLAKAIVEGQGGFLSLKSTPGEGTAFTLAFLTES